MEQQDLNITSRRKIAKFEDVDTDSHGLPLPEHRHMTRIVIYERVDEKFDRVFDVIEAHEREDAIFAARQTYPDCAGL